MELKLHANATTTPKIRAYIQRNRAPVAVLARDLGLEAAVTVSGLSSGGFFAHQFHVAYSELVSGAGISRCAPSRP